jgi:PhnB protein
MGGLIPYLNFENGKCDEAMNFYQQCLGGEYSAMRVKEMPKMASQMPPEMGDSVLHGELRSGRMVMYCSDLNREKQVEGNTIQLCINCDSAEELQTLFEGLSAGGEVLQPVGDMPWGALYAEARDKYGKVWMFNFQKQPM